MGISKNFKFFYSLLLTGSDMKQMLWFFTYALILWSRLASNIFILKVYKFSGYQNDLLNNHFNEGLWTLFV